MSKEPELLEEFVLVPHEPTPDMRIAGGIAWSTAKAETYVDNADACYKAMLAVRPIQMPEEIQKACMFGPVLSSPDHRCDALVTALEEIERKDREEHSNARGCYAEIAYAALAAFKAQPSERPLEAFLKENGEYGKWSDGYAGTVKDSK